MLSLPNPKTLKSVAFHTLAFCPWHYDRIWPTCIMISQLWVSYVIQGLKTAFVLSIVVYSSEVDGFTIFSIHISHGFTRWLWWFKSTQFVLFQVLKNDSILDFNLYLIWGQRFNYDSFRAISKREWIQLIRSINISSIHSWDSFEKCCNYISFAHSPHLLVRKLAKRQIRQQKLWLLTLRVSCKKSWKLLLKFPALALTPANASILMLCMTID